MLRLYDYRASGNGYKVRLWLAQLGIPFERIELDTRKTVHACWKPLPRLNYRPV
jgi:glutathione S-transferase